MTPSVRQYYPADYPEICSWYHARNLEAPKPGSLPKLGYIYPDRAAGFLIQTDVETSFIEPLIADPKCTIARRDEALDLIVIALVEASKRLGYKFVSGFTKFPIVEQRAFRHGFKSVGEYKLFITETK